MATTLRTALIILLFAYIIQMQINLDADKTATRQIKNALELGVHDAALAVDPIALSEGKIIFEDGEEILDGSGSRVLDDTSSINLQKSLEMNLDIKSSAGYVYEPNATSFFKKDLYIVDLQFIDDRVPRNYPFIYQNDTYDINLKIDGPSVIAVMTTESPRWFKGGTTYIRQATVYEYKK